MPDEKQMPTYDEMPDEIKPKGPEQAPPPTEEPTAGLVLSESELPALAGLQVGDTITLSVEDVTDGAYTLAAVPQE
jgi:hypothetical protein